MNTSVWTEGYVTDLTYTAGFYPEQGPEWLNHACVLNGTEPVRLDPSFTYFDLGCGHGMTSLMLAASHPKGRFYAADFMPAHIASAQQLADKAQCRNLTLLENSFEELAAGKVDLPPLDFIALHGVYTWVPPQARKDILKFISRYLKPGGLVYVSYNALPGWSAAMPVRWLMQRGAMKHLGNSAQRLQHAQALLGDLLGAQAGFFKASPGLDDRFGFLSGNNQSVNYLIHEYLNTAAQPMYHADLAADFAAAKLDFVGQSLLAWAIHEFPPEQQKVIDAEPDPALKESLRDFMINSRFRKDIFVRGRRSLSPARKIALLRSARLALLAPRAGAKLGIEEPRPYSDSEEAALLDALAAAPRSFAELAGMPMFAGSLEKVSEMAIDAVGGAGHAAVFFEEDHGDPAEAIAFNRAVSLQSRQQDLCPGFASSVLGTGFRASLLERLVYAELLERPDTLNAGQLAANVLPYLHQLGHVRPHFQEARLEVADLVGHVETIVQHHVPLWRQLKAI